jgi:uncharacterized protein
MTGGIVHPDVAALLAVQADDVTIHELEQQLEALMPRVKALMVERDRAAERVTMAEQQREAELRRRRDIEERIAHHRQLHARYTEVLNAVSNEREAAAASSQLEQAARFIADEERELSAMAMRMSELEALVDLRKGDLVEREAEVEAARESISGDRSKIEARLGEVRVSRDKGVVHVPRALLSRYERIRTKHRVPMHPLQGASCGNCDTTIPMQRRSQMQGSGATDMCEGCGVLLYAPD